MPFGLERIGDALAACGLFVSVGTSGSVHPAAGFVAEARGRGARTVELNLEPSEGTALFDEARHGPATRLVPATTVPFVRLGKPAPVTVTPAPAVPAEPLSVIVAAAPAGGGVRPTISTAIAVRSRRIRVAPWSVPGGRGWAGRMLMGGTSLVR